VGANAGARSCLGVTLFDTSCGYQWKSSTSSEDRFGAILPRYRKSILVSTKFESRDPEKARKEFDRSLQRMKMDYVDFLAHPQHRAVGRYFRPGKRRMGDDEEAESREAGRFIGFSSMNSAAKSKEMMEKLDVDMAILAMNATKYGDFAKIALPVARQKKHRRNRNEAHARCRRGSGEASRGHCITPGRRTAFPPGWSDT